MTDPLKRDSGIAHPRPSFKCAAIAAQGSLLEPHADPAAAPRTGGLASAMTANHDALPIVCQIIGTDRCEVDGLVVKHNAPVLAMCRALVGAGYDLDRPLAAYRGETLCLRISSIGQGAKFTVKDNRYGTPALRRYEASPGVSTASPIRPSDRPATCLRVAL